MTVRHAIVSLGLVGALVCGWSATALAFTSDAMSSAMASQRARHGKPLAPVDEVNARHRDDNVDDMPVPSNLGLAVEIEIPGELGAPSGRRMDTRMGSPRRRAKP